MRGKPDNNRQDFGLVAFILRQEGHTVFNPTEEENDTDLRIAFAEDFAWLCRQAEALVLLPGWHCSDGARGERWIAQALDLPIFIMEETNDECLSQIIRDLASYYHSPQASWTTFPTRLQPSRRSAGSEGISITPESHYIGTAASPQTKQTLSFDTFSKGERSIVTD